MHILNAENFTELIIDALAGETVVVSGLENVADVAEVAAGFMDEEFFVLII